MLRCVALVRTDVSEEPSASFIKVTRIGELGTTRKNGVFWDVTPCGSLRTDVSEEHSASFIRMIKIGELATTLKNCVFWDVTPCGSCKNWRVRRLLVIVHSHCRENFKSYKEWRYLSNNPELEPATFRVVAEWLNRYATAWFGGRPVPFLMPGSHPHIHIQAYPI
jgi:hypothetical protein